MTSIADPHPEPPAAEQLVAYLDGELTPDECRLVEERLAADAGYRQQLRDLDQAWEALDALPSRKAHDDFARTTMELVTVAAQADASVVSAGAANLKRRRNLWLATAALAGALLGFAAAWLLLPNRNLALLRDLPVIRQVDVLRQVESAEFLRRLAKTVPIERLMNDEAAIDNELTQLAAINTPKTLETRRQWVEDLPPEEKVVLAAQEKRFASLDRIEGEQDRLRALEREISAGGTDLERTLLAYNQWLSRLTAGQQEDLRQDLQNRPVDDQVNRVERLVRQQRDQASRRLSAEDSEILRNALRQLAIDRGAELREESRRRGDKNQRRPEGGVLIILAREIFKRDDNNQLRDELIKQLSPQAQAHLDSLAGWRRNGQLWRWILDSLHTKVDSDELERFFAEKLSNDQREELLNLPPNEMQSRLERLYYATELGDRDVGQWWSEYRESGGGPPNRSGPGRPDFRPDGPRDRRRPDGPAGGPGGSPPNFDDRGRRPSGPGGPSGPPPRDGKFNRFPDDRGDPPPGGPPRDGRPPEGPPPQDPPPHNSGDAQETI